MLPFARKLEDLGYPDLKAESVSTLQVNLGWRCNQACKHCHLLAGPDRLEQMERDTIDEVIRVVERWAIPTVDLTGGSPELNPHYEYLVDRLASSGTHILTRCNLTVLLEPEKEHLPEFYRDHRVELACSGATPVSWGKKCPTITNRMTWNALTRSANIAPSSTISS